MSHPSGFGVGDKMCSKCGLAVRSPKEATPDEWERVVEIKETYHKNKLVKLEINGVEQPIPEATPDWEKELDSLWVGWDDEYNVMKDEIKSLIRQTLSSQKQQMVDRLEGMRKVERSVNMTFPIVHHENIAYNQAIDDVIKAIKEI